MVCVISHSKFVLFCTVLFSTLLRSFIEGHYVELKKANPDLPNLLSYSCTPRVFLRCGECVCECGSGGSGAVVMCVEECGSGGSGVVVMCVKECGSGGGGVCVCGEVW